MFADPRPFPDSFSAMQSQTPPPRRGATGVRDRETRGAVVGGGGAVVVVVGPCHHDLRNDAGKGAGVPVGWARASRLAVPPPAQLAPMTRAAISASAAARSLPRALCTTRRRWRAVRLDRARV